MGRTGISKYWYHNQIFKAEFFDAIVTDTKFSVDVPDSGDIIVLKTKSTDNGSTYKGDYFYKGGSYPPGEIELMRRRNSDGTDAFKGDWIESDERDRWTFEVDSPL